jgi:hypothetical protein
MYMYNIKYSSCIYADVITFIIIYVSYILLLYIAAAIYSCNNLVI